MKNKQTTQKFRILSPDGFELKRDDNEYTQEQVKTELEEFTKRFEAQGYYSSNNGRIPLAEIAENCMIIPI